MRTETLSWLACPVPGCAGPLAPAGSFDATLSESPVPDLVEALLTCGRCGAEYPVILGVALLETDLQSYLWTFWNEIESCANETPGPGISLRMRSYLGIPSAFTGRAGPPRHQAESLHWTTSPYVQAHFDPESFTQDHPEAWWRHAVEQHRSGSTDPYRYLMGAARDLAHGGRIAGLAVELGTSVGRGSAELAGCHEYSVGLDRSFRAVLTARRLLLGEPLPLKSYFLQTEKGRWEPRGLPDRAPIGNLDYAVASGDALPVAGGGAACAAALNVLCAVSEPLALIRELSRILRAGGHLLLSSPFWSDAGSDAGPRFPLGGPDQLLSALGPDFQIVCEEDLVPWVLKLAKRRWNVYLCYCVVATKGQNNGIG